MNVEDERIAASLLIVGWVDEDAVQFESVRAILLAPTLLVSGLLDLGVSEDPGYSFVFA